MLRAIPGASCRLMPRTLIASSIFLLPSEFTRCTQMYNSHRSILQFVEVCYILNIYIYTSFKLYTCAGLVFYQRIQISMEKRSTVLSTTLGESRTMTSAASTLLCSAAMCSGVQCLRAMGKRPWIGRWDTVFFLSCRYLLACNNKEIMTMCT